MAFNSTTRTLHVSYQYKSMGSILVQDDKRNTVYNVDIHGKWFKMKPSLDIHNASTNNQLASVKYSRWSSSIEAIVSGQPIALITEGFLSTAHSYDSPALGGQHVTWKPQSKLDELNMVLLDGQGMPLARFIPAGLSWKKAGRLEFASAGMATPALMDEIVSTALAVMVYRHIERQTAVSASASG